MHINIKKIFAEIEAEYRHVIYDPKANSLWVATNSYKIVGISGLWTDISNNQMSKAVKLSRLEGWAYIGEK